MLDPRLLVLPKNHNTEANPFPSYNSYYRARFLSSGPDVAIELAENSLRTYIDGVVRNDINSFTQYVSDHREVLVEARKILARAESDTVVLVGRWHRPEPVDGTFDAYLVHLISESRIETWPYNLHLFNHDHHQTAMTIKAQALINTRFEGFLRELSHDLTKNMIGDLTRFGIPYIDGVAWLPDDRRLPSIFCSLDWPNGLDRKMLLDTLEPRPSFRRNAFVADFGERITLKEAMRAARIPMYYFQIRQGGDEPYDPILCHFDQTCPDYADTLLRKIDPPENNEFAYASDWLAREGEDHFECRILV